ncbi:hypothetical protein [Saccharothrix sp. ST-888]|uniref:hypothetical protein n=1 Tax=Saccharothrix sp. ST-888 TaxID=1427391 RepID=UPI0005ECC9C5|nr:hypothetical protein [Saccharothrix sp. ST-888]KJK59265.1 hypothetical protein UK12_05415 [Saccharothrix sp. ST-888]
MERVTPAAAAGGQAGRIDGTDGAGNSAPTGYVRSGRLLMAEFRSDAYQEVNDPQFPKAGEFFTSCSDVDFG